MTKAAETRKIHAAAREAKRQERIMLNHKIKESCLRVMEDPEATAAERLEAIEILKSLIEERG